ncbi:hypothetical protein M153_10000003637, partial [Pseudoloma neurophilia]
RTMNILKTEFDLSNLIKMTTFVSIKSKRCFFIKFLFPVSINKVASFNTLKSVFQLKIIKKKLILTIPEQYSSQVHLIYNTGGHLSEYSQTNYIVPY